MSVLRVNTASVASQTIDQETVIIHFGSGMYYNTDAVGAVVWSLLETGCSAGGIVDALVDRYRGGREEIARATEQFLEELQAEGLIVACDGCSSLSAVAEAGETPAPPAFTPPVLNRYTDMADLLLLDPVHEIEDRRHAGASVVGH